MDPSIILGAVLGLIVLGGLIVFVLMTKRTAYLGPVKEELQKEKMWLRRGEYNAAMVKGRQNLELLLRLVAEKNGIQLDNSAKAQADAKEEMERKNGQYAGSQARGKRHGGKRQTPTVMTYQQFSHWLSVNGYLDRVARWELNQVRVIGNKAAHENYADKDEAWNQLNYLEDILKTVTEKSQNPKKRQEQSKRNDSAETHVKVKQKKRGGAKTQKDAGKKGNPEKKANAEKKPAEGKKQENSKRENSKQENSRQENLQQANVKKKNAKKPQENADEKTNQMQKPQKNKKESGDSVNKQESKAQNKKASQGNNVPEKVKEVTMVAAELTNSAELQTSEATVKKKRRRRRKKAQQVIENAVVETVKDVPVVESDVSANKQESDEAKVKKKRRRRRKKPQAANAQNEQNVQAESASVSSEKTASEQKKITVPENAQKKAASQPKEESSSENKEPSASAHKRRRRRRKPKRPQAGNGDGAANVNAGAGNSSGES